MSVLLGAFLLHCESDQHCNIAHWKVGILLSFQGVPPIFTSTDVKKSGAVDIVPYPVFAGLEVISQNAFLLGLRL